MLKTKTPIGAILFIKAPNENDLGKDYKDANGNFQKNKNEITIAFNKKSKNPYVQNLIDEFVKSIERVVAAEMLGSKDLSKYNPIKDGDTDYDGTKDWHKKVKGHYVLVCKSAFAVGCMDQKQNRKALQSLQRGDHVKIALQVLKYSMSGNTGISCYLKNVLFVDRPEDSIFTKGLSIEEEFEDDLENLEKEMDYNTGGADDDDDYSTDESRY